MREEEDEGVVEEEIRKGSEGEKSDMRVVISVLIGMVGWFGITSTVVDEPEID